MYYWYFVLLRPKYHGSHRRACLGSTWALRALATCPLARVKSAGIYLGGVKSDSPLWILAAGKKGRRPHLSTQTGTRGLPDVVAIAWSKMRRDKHHTKKKRERRRCHV